MGIDLGNLAALRTFRVLRALKTVAIVPGMLRVLEVVVQAKYIAVLDNICRDHCIHFSYLITYLQQFHFIAACISLRIIAPFVTRYILTVYSYVRPIFVPTNPIPFTSVCFLSIFPCSRSFRGSRLRNELSNSMHETALNVDGDRENLIVYHIKQFIVKNMLLTFTCPIFHRVSCRLHIEQVFHLNMILNKFSCRYP